MDKVILKNMRFDIPVGLDAWRRFRKPQPVSITIEAQPTSTLEPAASKDDVNLSLDYGKLYKKILAAFKDADPEAFPTIYALIALLSDMVPNCGLLAIDISLPKALLQARGGVLYQYQVDKSVLETDTSSLTVTVKQIACICIIGVNPQERIYKQTLLIDISVPIADPALGVGALEEHYTAALHDMVQTVCERVAGSAYHTIESLATAVAQIVTVNYGHTVAKVRIEKPNAITPIEAAAVEITRSKSFFETRDFWKVKLP
ncbi:dihydroneopterin aldolase [Cladophialophora bantiana CBS 173.52]|uniref:dihydroneopterin aldolase n=1 Tax=Cladophialophora bantiana (strain ATCC 10958 / CBS 173.52 / CDC B-1940 / NIH 8579) TaxID=1442370 RepID=A0A0D2F6A7_CLAB1|nr:dihydroneopterin aldolase [Cladophialophora bantiana CBS 173.52]KIW97731.1 dihydroneopterin aldolase [Cladophialophora bantiana CBS 173.52]